jgi:hypothetical protein
MLDVGAALPSFIYLLFQHAIEHQPLPAAHSRFHSAVSKFLSTPKS